MKQLHPRAVWLFFFRSLVLAVILFAVIFAPLKDFLANDGTTFFVGIVVLAIALGLTYGWARLSYHFYRYTLSEEGFKKESGVIWKKYVTIPYGRIQNVNINRGILARLLGLSDVLIQTAGMSATTRRVSFSAEGVLPGLSREDAERIRGELVAKARQEGTRGL